MVVRLPDPAPQSPPQRSQADARQGSAPKPAQPDPTKKATAPAEQGATPPALPEGERGKAGTGVLRRPGERDRDVLLGSLGIVAVAVIGSLILGAVLGAVLVFVKHRLGWGGPDKDSEDHISLREG